MKDRDLTHLFFLIRNNSQNTEYLHYLESVLKLIGDEREDIQSSFIYRETQGVLLKTRVLKRNIMK